MKIKNLFTFVAIAAIALTSCNKDNDGGGAPEGDNYSLFMKFEGLDGTKAETSPVGDQTSATFTSGRMYFTKQDGSIVRTVEISNTPGAVTPKQLQDGKLFEDVDKDVTDVYVIGNHNFGSNNYSNISQVKALEVDVLSQTSNLTWGVEKANLYGAGLVQPVGTAGGTASANAAAAGADKEAIFDVAPLLARLEIGRFIGAGDIEKYTIDGIYIHNFYEKMSITSDLALAPNDIPWRVSANIQDWTKYEPTPAPGEYDTKYDGYLYDKFSKTSDASIVVEPTKSGDVWAYNVLANAGAEPHIVIKLSGVELAAASLLGNGQTPNLFKNNQGADGEAYLTIVGYNDGNGRTSVLGGNIYKMSNLRFTESDLGETPYPEDDLLKLWVEVTVKKWTVIPVTPIFNN